MNIQVQVRSQDLYGDGDESKNMAMSMDEKQAWNIVIAPSPQLSMGTPVGSTVKRWQPSIHLGGRRM